MSKNSDLPKLDYQAFYITRDKIHNFAIVLGKFREQLSPVQRDYWHISLRVKPQGLTTTPINTENGQEFELLYNSASDQFKPILLMAVRTGMRLVEILSLKWEDINLKEDYLLVKDSKNYESRYVPIHPELKEAFIILKEYSDSDYVFEGRKSITRQWQKAFKGSGIPYCRFHDLRHTFGSNLVMNGVDIVTVAELMGHKDLSMTKRYSHPTPEHKKEAIKSLNFNNSDSRLIQIDAVEKLANQ